MLRIMKKSLKIEQNVVAMLIKPRREGEISSFLRGILMFLLQNALRLSLGFSELLYFLIGKRSPQPF